MKSPGYSLWMQPKGKVYNRFANLIKKLAKKYDAPVFKPHVTLLGGILKAEAELIKGTRELALSQKPFTIKLNNIAYEDFHFRTLFIRAQKSPVLVRLNNLAREIFGKQDDLPFIPHLSLLYGNYPLALKEQIIAEIGRDQATEFEVTGIALIKAGEIEDWKVVRKFSFSP